MGGQGHVRVVGVGIESGGVKGVLPTEFGTGRVLRAVAPGSGASASVLPRVTINAGRTSNRSGSRPKAAAWACRSARKETAASSEGGPEKAISA